jgi:hypothetical protein
MSEEMRTSTSHLRLEVHWDLTFADLNRFFVAVVATTVMVLTVKELYSKSFAYARAEKAIEKTYVLISKEVAAARCALFACAGRHKMGSEEVGSSNTFAEAGFGCVGSAENHPGSNLRIREGIPSWIESQHRTLREQIAEEGPSRPVQLPCRLGFVWRLQSCSDHT